MRWESFITHSFIIRPHTITAFDNTVDSINKAMTITQQYRRFPLRNNENNRKIVK
jgi:hypothetical protein